MGEGRDAQTIAALAQDLIAHGGDPKAIDASGRWPPRHAPPRETCRR